jgi:hypothetical protein
MILAFIIGVDFTKGTPAVEIPEPAVETVTPEPYKIPSAEDPLELKHRLNLIREKIEKERFERELISGSSIGYARS